MLNLEVQNKIESYSINSLLRKRVVIESRNDNRIISDRIECINFCSNDYLGLTTSETVKKAFVEGVQQYGFGSGSSALVSGYFSPQQQLEEKFAEFLNRDRAIYFNSGYLANLGVISALNGRSNSIISDKLCHASILDGIQLSKAKHHRFRHNNVTHLEKILKSLNGNTVVTEGVFSMEGDISPLDQISKIANKNKCRLIVDDAHGIGVLGQNGRGICEYHLLSQKDVTYLITPLGKAFGAVGGIVSGSNDVIEAVLQLARTYIYTTALPPAIAIATMQSLKIVQQESWRRDRLNNLIKYFIEQAKQRNLPIVSDDQTPIKSILIGDNLKVLQMQQELLQKGFYISCIRPPTVPVNTARIRITLNCNHQEKEIERLLDHITHYYKDLYAARADKREN
jgi:8-amino-7-oxononanoate synthase